MLKLPFSHGLTRARLLAGCASALLLTSACVGGDPGDGDPDPDPPGDKTIDDLVDAYGAGIDRCFGDWFIYEIEPNFQIFNSDELRSQIDRSDHPNFGDLNQQALNDCVAWLEGDDLCAVIQDNGDVDPSCEAIFPGLVEQDGSCGDSEECVDGLACKYTDDVCGTCVPELGVGDACGAEVNGACGNSSYCNGTECVVDDDEPGETFAAGDTCTDEEGCGDVAINGLRCVDSTCVDLEVVDQGEECDVIHVGFNNGVGTKVCKNSFSSLELVCDMPIDGSAPGTCVTAPAVGEDCTIFCAAGATCEMGTCVAAEPECEADTDCDADEYCGGDGTCVYEAPICSE